MPEPLGLLAELTYRCPLHCPYCSNPLNLASHADELTLEDWLRVPDWQSPAPPGRRPDHRPRR